jgi:hypothetical protein
MMLVVLIAGIGLLLAGLVTVGVGFELDLSFGNTLISMGALMACTGVILLALWAVVRELKAVAGRLGLGSAGTDSLRASRAAAAPRPIGLPASLANQAPDDGGFDPEPGAPPDIDYSQPEQPPGSPPPWHEETASRDRGRVDPPMMPAPVEAAPKPKRNLLFSSSSRKERERAEMRPAEAPAPMPEPPMAAPPAVDMGEPQPASFDDAWPKSERGRPVEPPRRAPRTPSTFVEPAPAPAPAAPAAPAADRFAPAARSQEQIPVTVLKSGVVDGMAYSLYSDGSIEAQMPEGMMRFASIDELRSHLDARP